MAGQDQERQPCKRKATPCQWTMAGKLYWECFSILPSAEIPSWPHEMSVLAPSTRLIDSKICLPAHKRKQRFLPWWGASVLLYSRSWWNLETCYKHRCEPRTGLLVFTFPLGLWLEYHAAGCLDLSSLALTVYCRPSAHGTWVLSRKWGKLLSWPFCHCC